MCSFIAFLVAPSINLLGVVAIPRVPIQESEGERAGHPSGGSFQGYAGFGDSVSDSTNQIETASCDDLYVFLKCSVHL